MSFESQLGCCSGKQAASLLLSNEIIQQVRFLITNCTGPKQILNKLHALVHITFEQAIKQDVWAAGYEMLF